MAGRKSNKMEDPLKNLSQLSEQLPWNEYEHAAKFEYLCEIVASEEKEKIFYQKEVKSHMKRSCTYILVLDGKVFKIGSALRGMHGRIGSYNTGKVKYRARGTNSASNYWCLQSFINLQQTVYVYAFFPETKTCKIFGEKVDEHFPSSKTIEGVVIRQFVNKYKMKPIGCTQS